MCCVHEQRAEFYYLDAKQNNEFDRMGLRILDKSVVRAPSSLPDPPHTHLRIFFLCSVCCLFFGSFFVSVFG